MILRYTPLSYKYSAICTMASFFQFPQPLTTPMQTLPLRGLALAALSPAAPATSKSIQFAGTAGISPDQLKQLHAQILRRSSFSHPSSTTPLLLSFLNSAPNINYALYVFRHVPSGAAKTQAIVKFIRELSRRGDSEHVLQVFVEMLNWEDIGFNWQFFQPALKAAAKTKGLLEGLQIHGVVAKLRLALNPYIQTALIGMYAACGRITDAWLVFDRMSERDIVAWNIIITGFSQNGLFDEALKLFEEMNSSGTKPDGMLLSTVLSVCGRSGNLTFGKKIHEYIVENHVNVDSHLTSALINMYASSGCMDTAQLLYENMCPKNLVASTSMIKWYSRAGQIELARGIFDQLNEKDLVCWSAMISGYGNSDQPQVAIDLFKKMQAFGLKPDRVTVISVISACANLGVLSKTDTVRLYVDKNGFRESLAVNNALVDMYAKCGSLEKAIEVFEKMTRKNILSWTTMIGAHAIHGDAPGALRMFHRMKDRNFEPNEVTFIWVLYACSHAGLVKEGREIFLSMIEEHNLVPQQEHYGCMVDLFGRANLIRDALEFIEAMPMAPNTVIWGSLMAACRLHNLTELGKLVAQQLLELDPNHDGAHVLLSNIYAKQGKFQQVGELRNSMRVRGIRKERAYSRIESNDTVHEFLVGDRNHEETDRIYQKLDEVVEELKAVGYSPDTRDIIVDLDDEEKKEVVLWHSEKLALCYGLIRNDVAGSCVRIVKNLRVCEDCHAFMKLASEVYGREIVVRDRKRFHRFKDGVCSCKDYW